MILFYIDESGTGLKDDRSPYFLLGSVAVQAEDWPQIDHEVSALKRRLIPYANPEDWEIKGRMIRQGQELFSGKTWNEREAIFNDITSMMTELPFRAWVIEVDKRQLPKNIDSHGLYQFAFWKLLDEINLFLSQGQEWGMLMLDSRSSLHSSPQDRRLVDAYRQWTSSRVSPTRFIDLPWFGNSEFYAGLQLADFTSYLVDAMRNKNREAPMNLNISFDHLGHKIKVVPLP